MSSTLDVQEQTSFPGYFQSRLAYVDFQNKHLGIFSASAQRKMDFLQEVSESNILTKLVRIIQY